MGDARKKRDSINLFRGAAALLLAASLLCTLAGQTLAASEPVSSPVSDNRPAVVIEGNAVVDSNGQPTGFFELSMKVRTKFYLDAEGNLVDSASAVETLDHPFRSAAVALRYDAELLTPVSWSYTPEDYAADVPGLDVSGANTLKPAYMETKKPDSGVSATAKVESYTASDANNSGRPTAQLVLSAEAGGTAVSYEQETAVCVVRFKYDLDRVTMRAGDNYVFLRPAATPTGADGKKFCVVWFAEDAVAAKSSAGQSVWYQGTKSMAETAQADRTYFYYYLDAPAMTAAGTPKTDGGMVFTGSPVKDYTSNLLSLQETGDPAMPGKVQFKLVNMPSYASGGVNMANMATILFYDWDDALLGVLTVEKGDARAAVNAYVEEKMIYPDLWASKHAGDAAYMESLDRAYTYRGTYPAEGPSGSTTVTDGDKYALTNKLDYAFYRRPTELVEPAPTDPEGTAAYWEVASNASSEEAYPYVNGWAVVADIKDIENVWTTFGVGELKDVNPAAASGRYTTAGTAANYFKLEDFSNLTPGIHYVKACYEPGTDLLKDFYYSVVSGPTYQRYGYNASTNEGTYSIQYQYARAYKNTDGWHGVNRARDPAVQVKVTPDIMANNILNENSSPFVSTVEVDNLDMMDVDITTSGAVWGVTYALADRYGENVVTGPTRSITGNEMNIPKNFDYEFVGDIYEKRQGTNGLVYAATINTLFEQGTMLAKGETNTFTNHFSLETIGDLNLRADSTGTEFDDFTVSTARDYILDAIQKAYVYGSTHPDSGLLDANGNVVLDWHLLQYHIIHFATGGAFHADGSPFTKEECGPFAWCRQDDCGGGSEAITNLSELLAAAYKAWDGSAPTALDRLTQAVVDNLYLRADIKGSTYGSMSLFKTALNTAIGKLAVSGHYDASTIGSATWEELQYSLIHKSYQSPPIAENYWWKSGGAPDLSTLSALLDAAGKVYGDGHNTDMLANLTMAQVDALYLRANANGAKFSSVDTFKNALERAVLTLLNDGGYDFSAIGSADWIEVQHLLISGNTYREATDLRADAAINYWWENGGTPAIDTVGDMVRVAYNVYLEGGDPALLSGLTMGKLDEFYLRSDTLGKKFITLNTFKAALTRAVQVLTAPPAPYTGADVDAATWEEIQYALIHGTYSDSITEEYWWKDGGNPSIGSYSDLLKYAYQVYVGGGDSSMLKDVTLNKIDGFWLRKDLNGVKFTTEAAFKTALSNAVIALTTLPAPYTGVDVESAVWEEFQYALIHGAYTSPVTEDYWWKNDGTKTISTLPDLMTAAYFVYGDGSQPNALDVLTDVSQIDGAPFWLRVDTDGNSFGNIGTFKTALQNVVTTGINVGLGPTDIQNFSWIQVQHFLLGNGYQSTSSLESNPSINYWWEDGGSKPIGISPDAAVAEILLIASKLDPNIGEESDTTLLTNLLDKYVVSLQLRDDSSSTITTSAELETWIVKLVDEVYWSWDPDYMDSTGLYAEMSWNEVQYYILTSAFATDASGDIPIYSWRPTSVSAAEGFSLTELEPVLEELDVEETLTAEKEFLEDTTAVPPDEEVPALAEPAEENTAVILSDEEMPASAEPAEEDTAPIPPDEKTPTQEEPECETSGVTSPPVENAALDIPSMDQTETVPVPLVDSMRICPMEQRTTLTGTVAFVNPADLPLRHAQIPLSRRTPRYKKILFPANQGGINQ